MESPQPLLEARGLSKSFPGVLALKGVDLKVYSGEVLAVVGENGAGKSTLMKILAGVQQPDAGEIFLDGKSTAIDSVQTATDLGIALIHQELNLAENLDVAANIFLGREPRRWGFVNDKKLRKDAGELLKRIGEEMDSGTLVQDLALGRKQMIQIAKALSVNARVLIMDEPTSSLSQRETQNLFQVIRGLKASGVGIVYISHRLTEVETLADRVVVLRDGECVGEMPREEITHDRMVGMMVGRELNLTRRRRPVSDGEVVLEVQGLATVAYPEHTSDFHIRAGEIVGLAGLVGAGRTELLETLFGIRPAHAGAVIVSGHRLRGGSPREAIRHGLALIPEDRKRSGLVLEMSVRENLSLAVLMDFAKAGFLDRKKEEKKCAEVIARLRIRTPSPEQTVRLLSGGNQQKVVLGKWFESSPKVLLLDEPTKGIDVGAKQEVYALIEEIAERGVGVLFVSSEMEEILSMSDRVLVMHEGVIAGDLSGGVIDEERIMKLATGSEVRAGVAN